MDFIENLSKASRIATGECRQVAKETWSFIDQPTRASGVYGAESEAAFKAILYHELRMLGAGRTELSLEPQKLYLNVDLAYCQGGLTWRRDNSEVWLVEVKQFAKQKLQDIPYSHNLTGIQWDILNLHDAKQVFPKARLVAMAAFVDYDSDVYVDRLSGMEGAVRSALGDRQVDLNGVDIVVS